MLYIYVNFYRTLVPNARLRQVWRACRPRPAAEGHTTKLKGRERKTRWVRDTVGGMGRSDTWGRSCRRGALATIGVAGDNWRRRRGDPAATRGVGNARQQENRHLEESQQGRSLVERGAGPKARK